VESNDNFPGRLVTAYIEMCGCCTDMVVEAISCFINRVRVEMLRTEFIYLFRGRRADTSSELWLNSFSVPQHSTVKVLITQELKCKLKSCK
jgi:hypothetical protein